MAEGPQTSTAIQPRHEVVLLPAPLTTRVQLTRYVSYAAATMLVVLSVPFFPMWSGSVLGVALWLASVVLSGVAWYLGHRTQVAVRMHGKVLIGPGFVIDLRDGESVAVAHTFVGSARAHGREMAHVVLLQPHGREIGRFHDRRRAIVFARGVAAIGGFRAPPEV